MQGIVILVDDDRDLVELLQLSLQMRGLSVKSFANAEDAIEYIDENADLVGALVADMVLPRADGLSVCNRLEELNPSARILVMTGDSRKLYAQGCERFRMLLKPVSTETLLAELHVSAAGRS